MFIFEKKNKRKYADFLWLVFCMNLVKQTWFYNMKIKSLSSELYYIMLLISSEITKTLRTNLLL